MLFRNTKLLFGTLAASMLAFGGVQMAIAQTSTDDRPFDDDNTPGSVETQDGTTETYEPPVPNTTTPSETTVPSRPTLEDDDAIDGTIETVPSESPFEEETIPGSEEDHDYGNGSEDTESNVPLDTEETPSTDTTVPSQTPFDDEAVPGDQEIR